MQNTTERVLANSRMLHKIVKVIDPDGDWYGEVLSVKDAETFLVKGESFTKEVSIFDVRSPEEE